MTSLPSTSSPTSSPTNHHDPLNPSLDVFIEVQPRVAGIERGRLHNDWLNCPYSIQPAGHTKGFRWNATFHALDDGTARLFSGVGETRNAAKGYVVDTLTKHMHVVIAERRIAYEAAMSEVRATARTALEMTARERWWTKVWRAIAKWWRR